MTQRDPKSALQHALDYLSGGDAVLPYQVCDYIRRYREVNGYARPMISESAITARLRQLRDAKFGGFVIECRPRKGSSAYEYQLVRQRDLFGEAA